MRKNPGVQRGKPASLDVELHARADMAIAVSHHLRRETHRLAGAHRALGQWLGLQTKPVIELPFSQH